MKLSPGARLRSIAGTHRAAALIAFGSTPLTQVQARSKCSRCGAKAAKLIVLPPV